MTGKPFTLEQVLEATRAVVDEKGHDYIYKPEARGIPGGHTQCVYGDADGNPSCLVGHVVERLDSDAFRQLVATEDEDGSQLADTLVEAEYLPDGFWTGDAGAAMQRAQDVQDSGEPWGAALYAAENLGADAD